jgi:uncharacterized membrane protein
MNKTKPQLALQTLGLFTAMSLLAGLFHELLLEGPVRLDSADIVRMLGGGFFTAVICWLFGPFILMRRPSRKVWVTGLILWIALCFLLQAIVVYSMTCCAM